MARFLVDEFIRPAQSLVHLKTKRAVQVLVSSAVLCLLAVSQAGAAVLGVDVSGYDGTVDWTQVRNAGGKAFAIIHATSGVNTTDKNFAVNAPAARDAGLLVGAYHFAYPEYFTAHQEAQKFLSVAGAYIGAGYLPPVLDIEDSGGSDNSYPYRMGAAALSQWIRDWCSEVEQATGVPGRRVILYSIRWYARNNYFQSDLNQHPFWVATYPTDSTTDPGNIAPWTTWTFQQYRSDPCTQQTTADQGGTCPGITGCVGPCSPWLTSTSCLWADLDSFNGDPSHLDALANGEPGTLPTIDAFLVGPQIITPGQSFTIQYTVSDSGGPGLKQVELRRTNGDGSDSDPNWHTIATQSVSGSASTDGSFSDTPPSLGNYWYGLQVCDNANICINERQAGKGPKEVTVATATATNAPVPTSTPTRTPTAAKPAVTTNPATDVGQTRATLIATVSSNGSDATFYFDYGQTIAYGETRLIGIAPGDVGPVGFGLTITGLNCSATYHFRGWAMNSGGTTYGDDQSFTTSVCGTLTPTPNVSQLSEPATLTLTNGASGDQVGWSVGLSSDATTVLLGAPSKVVNGNSQQGAGYVFLRTGATWMNQAQLTANDGLASDQLGTAAGLSSDGNTALLGAPQNTVSGKSRQGAAYVFVRSGTSWSQQMKLTADDGAAFDYFGSPLALSGDGNTVLIGATNKTINGNAHQGAAYVFVRSGTAWTQQMKLTLPGGTASDNNFGSAVALSGDGNTALIGAPTKGAVYVFVRNGTTWTQQAPLTGDSVGYAAALSGDGTTALLGASGKTVNGNPSQGAAYVFVRSGTAWSQQAELTANDGAAGDQFGIGAAALSGDGSIAIVGAPNKTISGNTHQGTAYVFVRNATAWTQRSQLTASDGVAEDGFGVSGALNSDGNTALIGDGNKTVNGNSRQGAAYVFVFTTPTVTPTVTPTYTATPTRTLTVTATNSPTITPSPSPSPTELPPGACCEYPALGACGVPVNGQCGAGGTPVLNAVCAGNGSCSVVTQTPTPSVTPSPTELPLGTCCEYHALGACGVVVNGQCEVGGIPVLNAVCGSNGSCSTVTPIPSPIATPTVAPCTGDCDGSKDVTVNELIIMVNIALGNAPLSTCPIGDADGSGDITVNEIIKAVGYALGSCPT